MKLPPSIVRLKIKGDSNFSLWLPLFLIWPFLFVIGILIAPFLLLISLFLLKGNILRTFLIIPASYNLVSDLKGLSVDITNPKQNISIFIK